MADQTPDAQNFQPGGDPAWKIHQRRHFLNGDAIIVENEEYGTRTRIYLGEPLNANEIAWRWMLELAAEELGPLCIDIAFAGAIAARKAHGAMAALGQRIGAGDAKIAELQEELQRGAAENDQLRAQNAELRRQLDEREAGVADAALADQPTQH